MITKVVNSFFWINKLIDKLLQILKWLFFILI